MLFRWVAAALAAAIAVPAHAAWYEAKSRHFLIYADLDPAQLTAFGERLERFDAAVRTLRGMDDPALTDTERLTVYAMEDESAVGRLFGSDGVLGFYTTDTSGSVAFVPRQEGFYQQRAEMNAQNIFFHEYAHHLQLGHTSTPLPAWVTEGFAEFFGTAEIRDNGDVRIGAPPQHREWSVQRYDGLTLAEMMAGTLRNVTGAQVSSLYGRGWLLTHMLNFDPEGRKQLQRYIDAIQKGVDPRQAAATAFGDLGTIDHKLDMYLRQPSFKTFVIPGAKLKTGPISLRPMRPGEAAIMDARMRLRVAENRKEGARVASLAQKVAQQFPDEPLVQLTLAQAQLKARDYAAAEAAGRRALARDPNLAKADVAVGRARMEAARDNPATADWAEIRSWFLRANKIEPENAEPLMRFYQSFVYAKATPTPNAVQALLYAVDLAPRDEDLRIAAVRQMVIDNRIDEARKLFGPVAFYIHSDSKWRIRKTTIMDALASRNRDEALTLLEAEQKDRRKKEED